MYKKSVFFLLFCVPLFIFAQEFNKFDAQGKRHGFWEKRYDSGRVRYSGTFEHGKEVGEFLFYENKIINNYPAIRKMFDNDIDKATVTFYDIYGKKKSEGVMMGKNRVGLWKYYDPQGKLILIEHYENNQLNGVRKVFYSNDSIAEVSEYKNGMLNGVTSRFSKDGIKLHEMTYQEGLLHGRAKFFEVNGNLKESGLYYKDYKVGKWDFYIKGEYMGYKEPNKQREHPSDEAILASIDEKSEKPKEYPKLSDEEILENIERKKEKEYSYDPPSDEEILENIKRKKAPKKEYSKITDDEILKSIAAKMEAKIKEIKRIEDAEILKNIQRKKAEEEKERVRKLTDEEILENIKKKQKESKN
ncbi:toxin-antitoxin system YwqK family antitoxin [Wenyingzhuangia sp. IMCC45467]